MTFGGSSIVPGAPRWGRVPPLQQKIAKLGKRGGESRKRGKNQEKVGENWEKEEKSGKGKMGNLGRFFHFALPDR